MTPQEIHDRLASKFSGAVKHFQIDNPDPWIEVDPAQILEFCQFLKEDGDLSFDFLESMSGVDDTENLWLVYHLFSYKHRHSAVLKCRFGYDKPSLDSVSGIWAAANWHEREQYDLFGFHFEGHPDLRRILLPEDWVGHPLRKDYEYPEEYHGIDHYRADPKAQFAALDDLAAKAAEKVKEQQAEKQGSETLN